MKFRRKGDKALYDFIDKRCIGRPCWSPGMYQHRAPLAGGGSRNTGSPDSPCCLNRAYRGCPEGPDGERKETCERCHGVGYLNLVVYSPGERSSTPCDLCCSRGFITVVGLPSFNPDLAKGRKAQGWGAA